MRYFNFLMLFLFCKIASAQTPQDTVSKLGEYSYLDKNFFNTSRFGWCSGITPAMNVYDTYQTQIDNKTVTILDTKKYSVFWISIMSIGYEPRLNLKNFDDKASFSISIPFDLSLGLSESSDDDINTGFLAASSGFFIDGNIGNHSTYNNIDKNGLSVGIGMRVTKAPLIGLGRITKSSNYKFDRFAFGPSIRFIFNKDKSNGRNLGYYIETGIPKRIEGLENLTNLYVRFQICTFINY